jgi:ATP-dependent Clp protease ATP-binding subunit ClpA
MEAVTGLSGLLRKAGRSSPPDAGLEAISRLREELETLEQHHVFTACCEGWTWSKIAKALGVTKQAAHKKHAEGVRTLQEARDAESVPTDTRVVVTAEARDAVRSAREEARAVGSRVVGTEHLLLGVLDAGAETREVGVLEDLGVDLDAARGCLQPTMASEDHAIAITASETAAAAAATGVSPLARDCLEQSLRETIRRGDGHLGVEHLLLALVSRTDGGAARTLEKCGTSAETVRRLLEPR